MIMVPELEMADAAVVGFAQDYVPGGIPLHSHERHGQLIYAGKGAMTVHTTSGHWVLPPQRALWVPAGMQHAISNARPLELRTAYIDPTANGAPQWSTCVAVSVTPLIRELIVACTELPWSYDPDGPEARLVRVLLDRLALVRHEPLSLPEPQDARAVRAATLLRADPSNTRTIRQIAREIGTSSRTLERLFFADTRMSIGAWRQRQRLMFALERLAAGDGVAATAFSVGYGNPSSFISAFRAAFRCTPAKYFAAHASAAGKDEIVQYLKSGCQPRIEKPRRQRIDRDSRRSQQ